MTQKPSATFSWAPLLWACFCLAISPAGASAELSQAEVQAAIEAAFAHGYPSASVLQQIRNFVQAGPPTLNRGVGYYAFAIDATTKRIETLLKSSTNSNASASVWTTNDVHEVLSMLDGVWQEIINFNKSGFPVTWNDYFDRMMHVSFEEDPGGDLLRTWDPNTLAISDTLDEDVVPTLRGIQQHLSSALKTISDNTATIVQQGDTPDPNLDKIAEDVDAIRTSSYSTAQSVGEGSDRSEYMGDPQAPGHDKEGLAGPSVSIDSSALDEDLQIDVDGDARLYLWRGMSFDGRKLPDGVIDFSTGQVGNACYYMRRICSTLWWLVYYAALAVLLRREFVYYSSLGHTEGAA